MAGTYWSIRPPGEPAVEPEPSSADVRAQERLTRAVEAKLAEGFEIESRSDTQVVLVKHPKRWLGVELPGATTRALVALDQSGHPTVHTA
jgi:hypothetical protein